MKHLFWNAFFSFLDLKKAVEQAYLKEEEKDTVKKNAAKKDKNKKRN